MRLVLVILAAALIIGAAYHAWSSPNPKAEMPFTATESLKESDKPSARCLQATTVQRFSVKPDGKMQYLGGFTMWTKCEK